MQRLRRLASKIKRHRGCDDHREVVDLERRLRWFEKKPLFGQKIVVTRSREQSSELGRKFEALGAEVSSFRRSASGLCG